MKKIMLAVLSFAIAGAAVAQDSPTLPDSMKTLVSLTKDQQNNAMARASENLLEPFSAHFRNLTGVKVEGQQETYVCGEVDTKDSRGEYMGYTPFFLSAVSGMAMANGSDGEREKVGMFCSRH